MASDHASDDRFYHDLVINNLDTARMNTEDKYYIQAKQCAVAAIKCLLKLIPKEPVTPYDFKHDSVPIHSIWTHFKGGTYVVLGTAVCRTNGERDGKEVSVVYVSVDTGNVGYREIGEFLERFTRMK